MRRKNQLKNRLIKAVFGCFFVLMSLFGVTTISTNDVQSIPVSPSNNSSVETIENNSETTRAVNESDTTEENSTSGSKSGCHNSLGAIGWVVCPTTGKISEAVDWLYEKIESILVIDPIPSEDGSPIYEIWKYCRAMTNIVFIIFLLIVIYSQITGIGISNYGIKKMLPKMIITAMLVNLSFLICSLAVDVSNIIGSSIRGLFNSVAESAIGGSAAGLTTENRVTFSNMFSSLAGGTALTIGALVIGFETGAIWMLIPVVLGAIVAVASGLITIALRQAVVALLIMISPLAMVAYMMPNTEDWFRKWKKLLTQMLVFYPVFSLLFGASNLAGFAIIASAKDGFSLLLGVAVQIFPLFFSWSLMKMSGTFLGTINSKIRGLTSAPLATNRAWADSHRQLTRQRNLASDRAATPSLRLMQFISNRRVAREEDISEAAKLAQARGQAYRARRNWRGANATGAPTRRGERAYKRMAQEMEYQQVIERDKNTMNKGLGYLAAEGTAQRARLDRLDGRVFDSVVNLRTEQARGEKINYDNAIGYHNAMQASINAHTDSVEGFTTENGVKTQKKDYKFHLDPSKLERSAELARYNAMHQIMEGNDADVQYAAAIAAQGFDTQQKIYNTRMQKYFDLTPASKDIKYRLDELTRVDVSKGQLAVQNMDAVLSGLRVFNQRGDTDLIKEQIDNVLDKSIGGGMELGTLASQSLASFLMFEVKDSDPFLRRFGKYINLETANIYNENKRKEINISYDEYLRGYHVEPNGEIMYAKKPFVKLIEGTSLDNIERVALANLDESLKKAYGFDKSKPTKEWKVDEYLKKREEVQTAFEPAFLSSSMKWLSGSEQINSGIKFWTGYELKQQKDKDGNVLVDKDGDPIYDLSPVWNEKEFAGHEREVEQYYRRKTRDFFKDQTTGQILNMRTDYREPTKAHMFEMYLNGLDEEKMTEEERQEYRRRQAEYKKREAEIQTRYADLPADEAAKKRKNDISALKMEFAGRQVRTILGESGKLKQIYRTRTSGTAINAKDWLRKWVNLDNEDVMREEVAMYEEKRKQERSKKYSGADDADGGMEISRIYSESDKENYLNEMLNLKDRIMDEETALFFEQTRDQLVDWFGEDTTMVKKYEDYYHKDSPDADNIELYGFLKELLDDLNNYPDA